LVDVASVFGVDDPRGRVDGVEADDPVNRFCPAADCEAPGGSQKRKTPRRATGASCPHSHLITRPNDHRVDVPLELLDRRLVHLMTEYSLRIERFRRVDRPREAVVRRGEEVGLEREELGLRWEGDDLAVGTGWRGWLKAGGGKRERETQSASGRWGNRQHNRSSPAGLVACLYVMACGAPALALALALALP
jgi:hypothetical protein